MLAVVLYIFAVVGMQLFRAHYTIVNFPGAGVPRWSFADFPHALLLVFRVLCGNWAEPAWDAMRVVHPAAALFFIAVRDYGAIRYGTRAVLCSPPPCGCFFFFFFTCLCFFTARWWSSAILSY